MHAVNCIMYKQYLCFNNHLWQARIQLDMQYLHIKIHIVFIILKASENIYVYTVYTHSVYRCIYCL